MELNRRGTRNVGKWESKEEQNWKGKREDEEKTKRLTRTGKEISGVGKVKGDQRGRERDRNMEERRSKMGKGMKKMEGEDKTL